MSEQLAAAAAALNAPEELVERSARARASAQGVSYEEIIAAWAGGEAPPAAAAQPAAVSQQPAPAADEADEAPAVEEQPAAEVAAAPAAAAAAEPVAAPAAPATVSAREALDYQAVTTVATVGIKERTSTSVPGWLTSLFVALPVAALIYFISFSTGPNCGVGGQLEVDRQTGVAENCDGSEFAHGGAAGGVDPRAVIAVGQTVYSGGAGNCATCHGANGGGGTGPQMSGGAVLNTFASCADQIEWVTLGSSGFQAAGRNTYGDTGIAIAGGMPGFGNALSPEDLASVVYFERVNFGGADPGEALIDCGFVEPEGEEGEETPAEEMAEDAA